MPPIRRETELKPITTLREAAIAAGATKAEATGIAINVAGAAAASDMLDKAEYQESDDE